jgi:glycosyltransferase involved in cell wall biosynthesis
LKLGKILLCDFFHKQEEGVRNQNPPLPYGIFSAMKILFVADGRSAISRNWIQWFVREGHEVYLASTFACDEIPGLKGLEVTPAAFSGVKPSSNSGTKARGLIWGARTLQLRAAIRQWFGPLTLHRASRRLREMIERVNPDIIHAMRIPYEGMLSAEAYVPGIPLVVSIWGNDFTLHAPSTPLMRHYTGFTMKMADALHADCFRDIRLGKQWGFDVNHPTLVTPGNGGIRTDVFYPPASLVTAPVIINPRGFRAYVRNDTFFKAIPLVLNQKSDARFLCVSMTGEQQVLDCIKEYNIGHAVELLEPRPHSQMADVFRSAAVLVSPSTHDGTPNTLLEGMACGCFPIAGDLESIREWITPGKNGLLIDPANPQALADAILSALDNPELRASAAAENGRIIAARAEYEQNMQRIAEFYRKVIGK